MIHITPQTNSARIFTATILLMLLGLLFIFSASQLKSLELFAHPYHFFFKQGIFILICLGLILLLRNIPYNYIRSLTLPLLFLSLTLLALIFVPGIYRKVGGAYRWLRIGSIGYQPSELVKIALVLFLASHLSRESCNPNRISNALLPCTLTTGLICSLLLIQPDFGTSILLCTLCFLMLYIAKTPFKQLFGIGLVGLGLASSLILTSSYRTKRLLSFFNPWEDAQASGFQIIQSYLSFNNGGLLGLGLGESRQKLYFLPEAHTDFIFAVIAEEMGFLGISCILLLFLSIIYHGLKISYQCENQQQKLVAFGMTSLIAAQAIFNIAVVMGMLPTKGIALPFVSYGVSSLITFSFAIGILLNISKHHKLQCNQALPKDPSQKALK